MKIIDQLMLLFKPEVSFDSKVVIYLTVLLPLAVIVRYYIWDTVLNRIAFWLQKKKDGMLSHAQTVHINLESDYYSAARNFDQLKLINVFLVIIKVVTVICVLEALVAHAWLFYMMIAEKASLQEMLCLLMISIALALTSSAIKREV